MSRAFEIEVHGHRYSIRGDAEESHVQGLARQVDERMRILATQMKTATPLQLAILTAINLADELTHAMRTQQEQAEDLNRRAAGLIESIQETLDRAP